MVGSSVFFFCVCFIGDYTRFIGFSRGFIGFCRVLVLPGFAFLVIFCLGSFLRASKGSMFYFF